MAETLKATRGIEKDDYRIDAGDKKARSTLEGQFGKQVVAHYLKIGTLVKVRGATNG